MESVRPEGATAASVLARADLLAADSRRATAGAVSAAFPAFLRNSRRSLRGSGISLMAPGSRDVLLPIENPSNVRPAAQSAAMFQEVTQEMGRPGETLSINILWVEKGSL